MTLHKVKSTEDGMSLRQFMKSHDKLSAKQVNHLIDQGGVKHNGRVQKLGSARLSPGDHLSWNIDQKEMTPKVPEIHAKGVIFENNEILVYNKSPGHPSQATRDKQRWSFERAIGEWGRRTKNENLILCHRLDKDTSGALVFAKGKDNAKRIMEGFKKQLYQKTYLAITHHPCKLDSGTWKHYLAVVDKVAGVSRYAPVRSGGKTAITEYRVLCSKAGHTLWMLEPKTGRTHQLRVQLKTAGFPIVGDDLYAKTRQVTTIHHLLHAFRINIRDTNNQVQIATAAPPPLFMENLEKFGMLKDFENLEG